MQCSKKFKNFIYFVIYLIPFIFLLFSFLPILGNQLIDIPSYEFVDNYILSFYSSISDIVSSNIDFFPISYLSSVVLGNSASNIYYGFGCFYLDYCIWISLFIIAFDVISLLLTICKSFIRKLGGVNYD